MQLSLLPTLSDNAETQLVLARDLLNRGRSQAARHLLNDVVEAAPSLAEARYLLACALHDLRLRAEALAVLQVATALDPDHALAAHRTGVVLSELERWSEALPWLRRAADLDPDRAIIHRDLAVVLLFTGDVEAARGAYERSVELGEFGHLTLNNLVDLTPMGGDVPQARKLWSRLHALESRSDLTHEDRVQVCYALGKAYADLGNVQEAAAAWAEGARLRRSRMSYSVEGSLARWREIARTFDERRVKQLAGAGADDAGPVFICGLPRSGTTLVEQILSAHPQVCGAGEIDALPKVVGANGMRLGSPWPLWAQSMSASDCRTLAEAYLRELPARAPEQTRITDKRLENAEALGLIHACFPNAALILVRRDLRDVAFSCWTTLFAGAQPFTYDLNEMASYFRGHEALMAHWRKVLPPGRLLEVPYEALVADPEAWSRRIVVHCGLAWDDRCREPHKAERAVITASAAQVRRPIYGDAVGRWKPYAEALKPLIDRLGDVLHQ